MTKYQMIDGEVYEARDELDLVQQMREAAAFAPTSSVKAFMSDTAERTKEMTDITIDTSTPEAFVKGLVRAGLIEVKS